MNIENRIKKLEKTINPNDICACRISATEIYLQDLGANSTDTNPKLYGEPMPDVCPTCRKTIEKQVLIIRGVDKTSRARFPELMKD